MDEYSAVNKVRRPSVAVVVPIVVGRRWFALAQVMVVWHWGVGWMTVELWAECQKAW